MCVYVMSQKTVFLIVLLLYDGNKVKQCSSFIMVGYTYTNAIFITYFIAISDQHFQRPSIYEFISMFIHY